MAFSCSTGIGCNKGLQCKQLTVICLNLSLLNFSKISLAGSTFSTVAVAVERYMSVVFSHFTRRWVFSDLHMMHYKIIINYIFNYIFWILIRQIMYNYIVYISKLSFYKSLRYLQHFHAIFILPVIIFSFVFNISRWVYFYIFWFFNNYAI